MVGKFLRRGVMGVTRQHGALHWGRGAHMRGAYMLYVETDTSCNVQA